MLVRFFGAFENLRSVAYIRIGVSLLWQEIFCALHVGFLVFGSALCVCVRFRIWATGLKPRFFVVAEFKL